MTIAGKLRSRVSFERATMLDDDLTQVEVWEGFGVPHWAQKTDVSDAERFRAQELSAQITTRFLVQYTSVTSALTPKDRLVCEGRRYDISGIKEVHGHRRWLEITAAARSDTPLMGA